MKVPRPFTSPMGASQSKEADEKVVYNDTPVQFSQDVLDHLSDNTTSPETSPDRQSALDAHIRSRIQQEIARLRQEEGQVKEEIEKALEKENLDREREMAGEESAEEGGSTGLIKSSTALLGDVDAVKQRVDRFQQRRGFGESPKLTERTEALLTCYRSDSKTPLNCWKEVDSFKTSVAEVEQRYVDSLRH